MSILNVDIENVEEPKPVPDGEYEMQVIGTPELRTSKAGNPYLNVRLAIVGEVGAQDVYDTITLPTEDQDPVDNERRKLRLKRFCDAFGISYDGGNINLEEADGLRASALLTIEANAEYGDRNRVKRYTPIR